VLFFRVTECHWVFCSLINFLYDVTVTEVIVHQKTFFIAVLSVYKYTDRTGICVLGVQDFYSIIPGPKEYRNQIDGIGPGQKLHIASKAAPSISYCNQRGRDIYYFSVFGLFCDRTRASGRGGHNIIVFPRSLWPVSEKKIAIDK
jgi:hypothetical protein